VTLPLKQDPPAPFSAFPEWFVEDAADFVLFAIQHAPHAVNNDNSSELVVFLIVFICSSHYVSIPCLVAKLIEAVFVSSPSLQFAETFHQRLLSHPLAQSYLAKALMKFYTDVESTGASSEFYDKFTIRHHIGVILKSMWANPIHQQAIVEESRSGHQFERFVNMLMNDTTFLLDESLESLKRVHDVQEAMDSKEWRLQSQEVQQSRQRQLSNDERQCRSYLTLASQTVDMLHYLSRKITEPFLRPELVDRLAATSTSTNYVAPNAMTSKSRIRRRTNGNPSDFSTTNCLNLDSDASSKVSFAR